MSFAEFARRRDDRVRMMADTVTIDRILYAGQMADQLQVRRADCPQLS